MVNCSPFAFWWNAVVLALREGEQARPPWWDALSKALEIFRLPFLWAWVEPDK